MRFTKHHLLAVLTLFISGCSTTEADNAYISPNLYDEYNCKQLSAERSRLASKLAQVQQTNESGQVLDTAVAVFAISQGYAYSSDDSGRSYELRRISNQLEVIDQTAIRKKCGI